MKLRAAFLLALSLALGGCAAERTARASDAVQPVGPRDAATLLAQANHLARNAGENTDRLLAAERLYLEVLETATDKARWEALNSYSVLLVRLGEASVAIDVLTALEKEALANGSPDCETRAVLVHNIGGALEELDRTREALAAYFRAFNVCPRFKPGLDGTLRLAWKNPSLRPESDVVASVLERLLEQGSFATAEEILRRALTQPAWLEAGSNSALFEVMTEFFTRTAMSPAEYDKEWRDTLESARSRVGPEDALWIGWISSCYRDPLPAVWDAKAVSGLPSPWNQSRRGGATLLSFLGMTADRFAESGEERQALARYALSWSLDPGSFESALGIASLLASASEDIDPSGSIGSVVLARFRATTRRPWSAQDFANLRQLEALFQEAAARHGREALQASGVH